MKLIVKRIVAAITFLCILLTLITKAGFLVRPLEVDADNMSYLYKEDKNSMNVVCVGSSAMYRFWIPQQAYMEQQFTSSLISTASQNIDTVPYLMEEVEKTQDVDLFVVEIRSIISEEVRINKGTEKTEVLLSRLGYTAMGMKQSLNRIQLIDHLLKEDEENTKLEWMIPILKYHDNIHKMSADQLTDRLNGIGKDEIYTKLTYMVTPQKKHAFKSNTDVMLSDEAKDSIDNVIEKANELGAHVLLIATPYIPTKTRGALQLQMNDYIRQQGYDYLDMTDKYDEIGLNLKTDFYDKNHMNISGAKKVTRYMAAYISDNYKLSHLLNTEQEQRWMKICDAWQKEEKELSDLWQQEIDQGVDHEKK